MTSILREANPAIDGDRAGLYGRKRFHVGGILASMASSLVAGLTPGDAATAPTTTLDTISMC